MSGNFQEAVRRIDEYNRQDPAGREPDHAAAVLGWILTLRPDASEALQLAGRAQHMGRWRIPRDTYPRNRAGYLRWRKDLQRFHADETAAILQACGYDQGFIDRVRSIMHKQRLKHDAETQTLEDALCLAFVERQLADFSRQHDEEKLVQIIRKTWRKMSPAGQKAAQRLSLDGAVRDLLARSLAEP